jgi:hypothetical protein
MTDPFDDLSPNSVFRHYLRIALMLGIFASGVVTGLLLF